MNAKRDIAAIRAGHAYIQQNHAGSEFTRGREGAGRYVLDDDLKQTCLLQTDCEKPARCNIVVHNHNFCLAHETSILWHCQSSSLRSTYPTRTRVGAGLAVGGAGAMTRAIACRKVIWAIGLRRITS